MLSSSFKVMYFRPRYDHPFGPYIEKQGLVMQSKIRKSQEPFVNGLGQSVITGNSAKRFKLTFYTLMYYLTNIGIHSCYPL